MSTPWGPPRDATARASRVAWHPSGSADAWTASCVAAIVASIEAALKGEGDMYLLLSGGTTPAPVYRALADAPVEWARVIVGLVDDRDVAPDADGSNARLIRETLLQGPAAAARFEPLRDAGQSIGTDVERANERWSAGVVTDAPSATSAVRRDVRRVAVLGMGDDGHTASLFPGAVDLHAALASHQAYAAIDATGCEVAGAFPHRISLTPHGLAQTLPRLLLLRGAQKLETLQRALQNGPASAMPIRYAIDLAGAPLQIHWCA